MELVVLIIVTSSIGLITRFSFPQREEYGLLLLPGLTLSLSIVVWAAGLLFGLNGDHLLLWALAIVIPLIGGIIVAKTLPPKRVAQHERRVSELLAR